MKAILAILLVAALGVNVDSFSFYGHDYNRTALGDSIDKASIKLLKEAYTAGEDKNVIASPAAVMMLLALYSAGVADGSGNRQEISTLLGGSDYKTISEDYVGLSNALGNMDPAYFTLANKVYVKQGYTLDDTFSKTARSYKSDVESIDFANAKKAAEIINKWSDEKTRGNIKTPVSEDIITSDIVVGLFNVIFFQGHWHVPFAAKDTKDEDFHVDKSTTVKKPTMHLLQSLFYTESEDLGAKMVELPYKEEGFRMVVVLPNEIDGLSSVIEKAKEDGLLKYVFNLSPSGRDVNLYIPKFEINSKLDLNDLLPKIGVSKIFSEGATGIVKSEAVAVSKAFQQAFVKIDEEGATAGAFTGLVAVPMSSLSKPPAPMEFKVDRPFLFLILHKDKILFAGTYTK